MSAPAPDPRPGIDPGVQDPVRHSGGLREGATGLTGKTSTGPERSVLSISTKSNIPTLSLRYPHSFNDEGENNPGNNLYVTNLSLRTRERDLEKLFGEYGKVSKANIMYDPHSQESRGFAFVSFDLPEDAGNALAAISGKVELDGKVITVELAKRGRARTPTPGRYHGPPHRRDYDEPRRGGDPGYGGNRYGGDRGGDRYDRYPPRDRHDDRRGDRRDDRRDYGRGDTRGDRRDRDYDRRY
ncbi:hypothetical protein HDU86_001174 [Geranomyces michiganensis]|nr:hypothetical protein HDU86_001174 [Geranomyces michiganensis]